MFIGSTLGRLAVTRSRAEAVIAQLDSRLKNSERELRTGAWHSLVVILQHSFAAAPFNTSVVASVVHLTVTLSAQRDGGGLSLVPASWFCRHLRCLSVELRGWW